MSRLASTILLLSLSLLTGCNVLGYAASTVAGPPKTPAMFTPAKTPLVVIAENFANPAEASLDSEPIARFVSDDLQSHQVAPIIETDRVLKLQTGNPKQFQSMTIAAVGRAVGAEQILYINVIHVGVDFADSSDLIKGSGEVRVKVVDANTGASLWPTDSAEGFSVVAETQIVRRVDRNEAVVRTDVHRILAAHTARLFYTTKSE